MIRLKALLLEVNQTFKFNDRGPGVKAIQQKLIALGYSVGHKKDDGWFGVLTKRGIEQFQKQNSLPVTGEMDQATVDLINSADAIAAPKSISSVTQPAEEPTIQVNKQLVVTSPYGYRKQFGRMHKGTDYRAATGTDIQILMPGKVIIADMNRDPKGWGALVQIKHEDGSTTRYAHLSNIDVQVGDDVPYGAVIGKTGGDPGTPGAGRSTGEHLHWEYIAPGSNKQIDGENLANTYFTLK